MIDRTRIRLTPSSRTARGNSVLLDATAASSAKPVWCMVSKAGDYAGYGGGEMPFKFDETIFRQLIRNFRANESFVPGPGGEGTAPVIAWDFAHASEAPANSGSLPQTGAPAQGWISDLRLGKARDGSVALMAKTLWLEPARTYILEGRYLWASVTVVFGACDPKTGAVIGPVLTSVALTNKPFVEGLDALVAASKGAAPKLSIAPRKLAPTLSVTKGKLKMANQFGPDPQTLDVEALLANPLVSGLLESYLGNLPADVMRRGRNAVADRLARDTVFNKLDRETLLACADRLLREKARFDAEPAGGAFGPTTAAKPRGGFSLARTGRSAFTMRVPPSVYAQAQATPALRAQLAKLAAQGVLAAMGADGPEIPQEIIDKAKSDGLDGLDADAVAAWIVGNIADASKLDEQALESLCEALAAALTDGAQAAKPSAGNVLDELDDNRASALDARHAAGRNATERAIVALSERAPGFRQLSWDQKIQHAGAALRSGAVRA